MIRDPQFFVLQLVVLIFYIPVLWIIWNRKRQRRALNEFYRAVLSIIKRNDNLEDCIEQINIIYKKNSERYSYVSDNYRSVTDIMEDLLYRLESYSAKRFKETVNVEFTDEDIGEVVNIIKEMKRRQPYSSLNSKHGNLLNLLKTSVDNNNKDLAQSTIQQLSDEIEILEGTVRSHSKRNQISLVVSAIGVVLTFVFGLITVVQALRP